MLKLLSDARENAAKHYDDLFRTFVSLDTKAQSTAAAAGVQLAALVAFLQRDNLRWILELFGAGALYLVIETLVVLTVVIGGCIFAMRVRSVPAPFCAPEEIGGVRDLYALPGEEYTADHVLTHLDQHLEQWHDVVTGMQGVTLEKAESVAACQWAMLLGLCGTVLVFVLLVLSLWG
jgi:hypothetical protein